MEASHKTCSKCGGLKPLSEFHRDARSRDGCFCWCKTCKSAWNREQWTKAHPPKTREPSMTYKAVHRYLGKTYPKTGICEGCGKSAPRTQYALIHGRQYTRNREDYRELCAPCHGRYDAGGGRSYLAKLTANQILEIRRRYEPGVVTLASLAGEFKVTTSQVSNIVRGLVWVDLLAETGE